jgi:gas vesicle protein
MTDYSVDDGFETKYLWGFLVGLLAGSLIGAGAMLLLAPQSGRRTRAQIQRKSAKMREQTADIVDDSLAQARARAGQITDDVRQTTDKLEQRAQAVFDTQSGRVSSAVKAGKNAVRNHQG